MEKLNRETIQKTKYDVISFPADALELNQAGVLIRKGYEKYKKKYDMLIDSGYEISNFSVDGAIVYILFQR